MSDLKLQDISRLINQVDPVDISPSFLDRLETWDSSGRFDEDLEVIDSLIEILTEAIESAEE